MWPLYPRYADLHIVILSYNSKCWKPTCDPEKLMLGISSNGDVVNKQTNIILVTFSTPHLESHIIVAFILPCMKQHIYRVQLGVMDNLHIF